MKIKNDKKSGRNKMSVFYMLKKKNPIMNILYQNQKAKL